MHPDSNYDMVRTQMADRLRQAERAQLVGQATTVSTHRRGHLSGWKLRRPTLVVAPARRPRAA